MAPYLRIPEICIFPASPQGSPVESQSPFSFSSWAVPVQDTSHKPVHLNPQPKPRLSPLHPAESAMHPVGWECSVRGRRSDIPEARKKDVDLRREVALKSHKAKQAQSRALFLSKVLAPPSLAATHLPKTPPESPAIFHYSLPSPGLESPLALFESLANEDPSRGPVLEPWIEQVDFRLLQNMQTTEKAFEGANKRKGIRNAVAPPSLAEISARMGSQCPDAPPARRQLTRLPSFLRSPSRRARRAPGDAGIKSPALPTPPQLTADNLPALDARACRSQAMLSTIRRRTSLSPPLERVGSTEGDEDVGIKERRRISAPAELSHCMRAGFEHPVLSMPGGF